MLLGILADQPLHEACQMHNQQQQDNAAASLAFPRVPPQNRLEQLKKERKVQWSIRVNDRFRLCSEWRDGHAWRVDWLLNGDAVPSMLFYVHSIDGRAA